MQLLFSWIVSGQTIKPTRYIDKGDTFTVFTIQSEREIILNLSNAILCNEKTKIQDSIIVKQQSIIQSQAKVFILQDSSILASQKAIVLQKDIIRNQNILVTNISSLANKYRQQRNISIISGTLLVILAIFL